MKTIRVLYVASFAFALVVASGLVLLARYLSSPSVVGDGILREVLGADRELVEIEEVGVEWTQPATFAFAVSSTNWSPVGLESAERYPDAFKRAGSLVDELLAVKGRSLDPRMCRIAWKQIPGERTTTFIIEYEKGRYFLTVER
jgi:hypothetical protein